MKLSEAKAAVLARVREAGADGSPIATINDVVGPLAWSAIVELLGEGRVLIVDGERVVLTAAQRELDELRASKSREYSAGARDDVGARPGETLAKRLQDLWLACELGSMPLDFAAGLRSAAWIAFYGGDSAPKLQTARLMLTDGTSIRCAVLGYGLPRNGCAFVLAAPGIGRVSIRDDGRALMSPARLHPDDLAALRGEGSAALASAQVEG